MFDKVPLVFSLYSGWPEPPPASLLVKMCQILSLKLLSDTVVELSLHLFKGETLGGGPPSVWWPWQRPSRADSDA